MIGEPLLQMVEHPELVEAARRILDAEEVHVGACGIGDASKIVSADGRLQRQVHWHVDGGPEVKQVSFRTALDRHDASNAPLRVLPGSQHRLSRGGGWLNCCSLNWPLALTTRCRRTALPAILAKSRSSSTHAGPWCGRPRAGTPPG